MYKMQTRNNSSVLGSAGLTAAMIMTLAIGTGSTAEAGVFVDKDNKVQLYGDLRYRIEMDTRVDDGVEDRDRDRSRLRARVGIKYQADDNWAGNIRLATNSGDNQSPHHTFGTVVGSGADNEDFGLDRAHISYTGVENLTLTAGKFGINYWQQSELFMDTDIGVEGAGATYKIAGVTLNAAYILLHDMGWQEDSNIDATLTTYQAVYSTKIADIKLTGALGGATFTNSESLDGNVSTGPLPSEQHLTASVQAKYAGIMLGVDYMSGDANEEETAFLLQARYKINDMFGVRLHYYDVGLNAVLAQGIFTQDDFPEFADFTGYQAQLDVKVAKNVSIDLRYFSQEEKEVAAGAVAWERTRAQANLNVKF